MNLSIVIPLYNEKENVEPLYAQLKAALEGAGREYEIIIVDDGSTDRSFDVLKRLHEDDERLKVIRFRRNFGQTAAFAAGFDRSQGEVVITVPYDPDLDSTFQREKVALRSGDLWPSDALEDAFVESLAATEADGLQTATCHLPRVAPVRAVFVPAGGDFDRRILVCSRTDLGPTEIVALAE